MSWSNPNWRPKHCETCGRELLLIEDPNGFWTDNGEPRFIRWLKCPNWTGGRTMHIPNAWITYTALEFNRKQNAFVEMFGYTRYQTCDLKVVY